MPIIGKFIVPQVLFCIAIKAFSYEKYLFTFVQGMNMRNIVRLERILLMLHG